ncbi:MAG: ABC transporter permease [Nanoarchaeota archaeon]
MLDQQIRYSLRNLRERKSRTLLTAISIFMGIATIFIFISFGWGLYDYINELGAESGTDKLIVQPRSIGAPGLGSSFKLEDKDLREVQRTRGVSEAAGMYFQAAEIESDDQKRYGYLVGVPEDSQQARLIREFFTIDIEQGRQLRKGDNKKVVLGNSYLKADVIFSDPLEVGQKVLVQGAKFKIIGFYESVGNPSDDANIYIPEDDFTDLYENPGYGMIVARVTDEDDLAQVSARVEEELRDVRDLEEGKEDFFVQTFQELIDQFRTSLDIVIGFIVMIAFISVIVSAINTANTMVTSVLERTREIGVMKSIGARNSTIRNIFIIESSIIGLLAGIIGVLLGWLIASAGADLLDTLGWGFLSPHYSWILFAGCIFFATLVGAISGVIPAIQAARENPVEALRYE